ncbi:hypothetical protein RFI_28501 [Reticulomyxa filosa]|uniref:Uncharacterized protein n=1 Tax=Reticulomyxa filosa TaxID=46433 RepID=X6M4J0_RETFI|nr:hypothetical protein RFI_28501 [Reticulomyxa filosa]|eukprot:ETO08883.1 hypothetical protein RFI_28501 [Reticulomyxa filosa]
MNGDIIFMNGDRPSSFFSYHNGANQKCKQNRPEHWWNEGHHEDTNRKKRSFSQLSADDKEIEQTSNGPCHQLKRHRSNIANPKSFYLEGNTNQNFIGVNDASQLPKKVSNKTSYHTNESYNHYQKLLEETNMRSTSYTGECLNTRFRLQPFEMSTKNSTSNDQWKENIEQALEKARKDNTFERFKRCNNGLGQQILFILEFLFCCCSFRLSNRKNVALRKELLFVFVQTKRKSN